MLKKKETDREPPKITQLDNYPEDRSNAVLADIVKAVKKQGKVYSNSALGLLVEKERLRQGIMNQKIKRRQCK